MGPLEFITQDHAGNASEADVGELGNPDGVGLSAWAGASSGLLDRTDLDEIVAAMQPGSVAAVILYENPWALSLVSTWRRGVIAGPMPRAECRVIGCKSLNQHRLTVRQVRSGHACGHDQPYVSGRHRSAGQARLAPVRTARAAWKHPGTAALRVRCG